ncbi:glutaminyl-peptide cyclotransferase [Halioxenophilus sp. WMMB6]|uniref:glutaminyl-peptide cyclotransferase n=1 Tax=Halioxenophilus sp. WMMB6 TaxID=3073815 RepID=UPI00295F5748|nr:glutaminyl-peptide cyclotransferase [Halioxenophilus sp. WMMB6]
MLVVTLAALLANLSLAAPAPPTLDYQILELQAHPPQLFTQGLLVDGPWLYESSGGYGKSLLARYKAADGSLLASKKLPKDLFAEGLTLFQDYFYLLTWRKGEMRVFDRNWNPVGQHYYLGEGWGLTNDGQYLIVSDGTDRLHFYQPEPFEKVKSITVTGGDQRWTAINELEYVNGVIWANRWFSDQIIAIDPTSGQVLAVVDFSELARGHRTGANAREKVLNGLAWSEQRQAMWVTGKLWDRRYLVTLPAVTPPPSSR